MFNEIEKENVDKLLKVLTPILREELDNYRDLFADIELQDLVNNHMSAVLPDGTIKRIRKAILFNA